MRMIFLRSAEGSGKGKWGSRQVEGNPGIQFDLPQLSLCLCSSWYVSKVRSTFFVLSRVKMQRNLEQRCMIKFCVKLGKSGSETLELLRAAYGDAILSSAQVFRWHKAFKDGRESVEDEQHAGHPSTSRTENNVAHMKSVLDRDRRLNVRLIAEEVRLPKMDVHQFITEDLHMRKICAKLVLKNLSDVRRTSIAVRQFLAKNNITVLPHPPYSPDLATCNFFLFLKLKTYLKGHNFGTVENVQAAVMRALNNFSSEDFLHCYEEWQQRWNCCIQSQGAYFEGDKL